MSEAELRAIVRDEVTRAVKAALSAVSAPKQYLTAKEVARRLSLSVKTVRRWTKDGKLKPVMVGQRLRYDLAEIDRAAMNAEPAPAFTDDLVMKLVARAR
jgi:excisionase family DNA binding protein